jgi:hypothetical protein
MSTSQLVVTITRYSPHTDPVPWHVGTVEYDPFADTAPGTFAAMAALLREVADRISPVGEAA